MILVSNWTVQAAKFFDPGDLDVRAWNETSWTQDQTNGIVWVVKESLLTERRKPDSTPSNVRYSSSFWSVFGDPDVGNKVRILSSFADEAHVAWRSFSSERSKIFKKVTTLSEFNVLVSGTMFPRCPSSDARGILEHLGGDLDSAPGSRWSPDMGRAIRRLDDHFSVLTLRILLSPFYLRRTQWSVWLGRWIVDQRHARPEPTVLLPYPDDFSHGFKPSESKRRTQVTLSEIMRRADQRRFYAWTELYLEIQDKVATDGGTSRNMKPIEQAMIARLPYLRPSGRIRMLIAIIKAHRDLGEKFVIVSDRLFLLTLAYYVFPLLISLISDMS